MSSFPTKVDGTQVWSDFEKAGGILLHQINDVSAIASDKVLNGEETLIVELPGTSDAVPFLRRRRVIRLIFEDEEIEEWRIMKLDDADNTETWTKTVQCEGAIQSLMGPCLVEIVDDNGESRTRFELLEFTAAEHLENFILPASPSWWTLGLVEPEERFDLLYDNYTPLRAISEILRITGFEREVKRLSDGTHELSIVEFAGEFRLGFEDGSEVWTVPSSINLISYTSKTPEVIGSWEYNGGDDSFKVNAGASFGIERGVPSVSLDRWARTTLDITDDSFRVTCRVARLGVAAANTAFGIYLWAETTVARASIVGEGLIVFFEESGGGTMDLKFERRNAAGTVVQSGTIEADVAYPVDTDAFLRLVVEETRFGENPVVEVFRVNGTTLDPVPDVDDLAKVGEIAVGVDFRDGDHEAHGVYMVEVQGRIRTFLIESLPREELQPEFIFGKNMRGIARDEDTRESATKIYGIGGTDQLGRVSLATARFEVTALP